MSPTLLVAYELLLLLALGFLFAGASQTVVKRLLVFLLLLCLPMSAPWLTPFVVLAFLGLIGLAGKIESEKRLHSPAFRWSLISSAVIFLGSWLAFGLRDAVESFKLLPLEADFHPKAFPEAFRELGFHLPEAWSMAVTLLLLAALSLVRLRAWRKRQ